MFKKISEGLPSKPMFVNAKCCVSGDIFTAYYPNRQSEGQGTFLDQWGKMITFGQRPEDEWEEKSEQSFVAHTDMSPPQKLDFELVVALQVAARRKAIHLDLRNEDGTFNIDDWAGGNMDDAYSRGILDGETELARFVLTAIGVSW